MNKDIIIIGGGLGGLISAIRLAQLGYSPLLLEKKRYPFHRVCGEYISQETIPFLKAHDLYPYEYQPPQLTKFLLSDIEGHSATIDLPLGGFGISRFSYDHWLYLKAKRLGVKVIEKEEVTSVEFVPQHDSFTVQTKKGAMYKSTFVIGAFGKRSMLDKSMDRPFMKKRSPFMAVKYHAQLEYPHDQIGLYNFPHGYCGVSKVEDDMVNICYLSRRENMEGYQNIREMEESVLYQNPLLKEIWEKANFLWMKPEVINEVSFAKKAPVENHVLMVGDSAGLITPLCGNGMAMAIHAASIAAEVIDDYFTSSSPNRSKVESAYKRQWKKHFSKRLWIGRKTQHLFGHQGRSRIATSLIEKYPSLGKTIIKQTHGAAF